MCKQLAERFRKSGQSHSWKRKDTPRICEHVDIKAILERSIASPNPTSVKILARQLGYANSGYIAKKFPEECKALKEKLSLREKKRLQEMGEACQAALRENPVPSLAEIARRLGCSTSTVLSANFPELCQRIKNQRKALRSKQDADLEVRALALLKEYPPLSALEACSRLGISLWKMGSKFPKLRARFTENVSEHGRKLTALRREHLNREVLKTYRTIFNNGELPTVDLVLARLPDGVCVEWFAFGKAYADARKSAAMPASLSVDLR